MLYIKQPQIENIQEKKHAQWLYMYTFHHSLWDAEYLFI